MKGGSRGDEGRVKGWRANDSAIARRGPESCHKIIDAERFDRSDKDTSGANTELSV